jgi:hypothetical protein
VFSVHQTIAAGYPVPGYDHQEVGTVEEVARCITGNVYGAAIWAGGSRREWGFCAARWCVLDFDEGVTKDEARQALDGLAYVLAPSKSDGIEKTTPAGKVKPAQDRFRVLIPFSAPIWNLDVFRYNMKLAIKRFGSDPLPYDGGRVWQPSPRVETIRSGKSLDVVMTVPLEETQEHKQLQMQRYGESLAKAGAGALPRRVWRFLDGEITPSQRNVELFKVACLLFSLGWTVEKVKNLVLSIPEMADHDKIDSTLKSAAKRTGAAFF